VTFLFFFVRLINTLTYLLTYLIIRGHRQGTVIIAGSAVLQKTKMRRNLWAVPLHV